MEIMKAKLVAVAILGLVLVGGTVCAAEAGARQVQDPAKREQRREKKFAKIDANHDSALSKEEFVSFVGKKAPADPAKRERHRAKKFDRIDTNHDGQIMQDEFVVFVPQRKNKA
jgi:hypothetical protein